MQKIFHFLHITFVLRIKIQLVQQNQSKAPVFTMYYAICMCMSMFVFA